MIKPPRTGLEAFELMPEGTLCQLINNAIIMSPSPTPHHQKVTSVIYSRLLNIVEAQDLGEVLFSPIDVYLNEQNVYQPDIVFISAGRLQIIDWDKGIMGAPDLVIEILSKGNSGYDLKSKKIIYQNAGVKEYYVINPVKKWCEGFILVDGLFNSLGESTASITIRMFNLEITF